MDAPLLDITMHDRSRHFLCLPESLYAEELVERMALMPGITVTETLHSIPESWIDFEYLECKFSINNQFGEFWFFADDPKCPEETLIKIRDMFSAVLM